MEVPIGFVAKLWSFITFLPFFTLLFVLGCLKGLIICPLVVSIIALGNSAVVVGLFPAHFVWTYYCVAKTKRLGWILKILVLFLLPLPLILWPIVAIFGSLLGGIGFGFFAPLLATFEAVGENVADKFYHCFVDGCVSTVHVSCMVVRDFTDICYHSYFSYMDELSEEVPENQKPYDIKISKIPGCLLVSLLAVPIDVPLITAVALWKSPYMLLRGWKRLFEDMIGREGPFLETVCVPFAGLTILLWPLAVIGGVLASFFSSFFLALFAGVIVHQEDSLGLGFNYIVAVVSLFDEYVNDLLSLSEGSCFPRPQYRRNKNTPNLLDKIQSLEAKPESDLPTNTSKLVSQGSRTLKQAFNGYKPFQVWDWLFKSCELNGKMLLREGLITAQDIQECVVRGKWMKLGIKLPALSILECLLASAKSGSGGVIMSEGEELTRSNLPRDRVFEWFVEPLFTMKDQVTNMQLQEDEEMCVRNLVMSCDNNRPEEWDEMGFPSSDMVRRAQLQALIRRLQGIVGSMSRLPTFRRRFQNLIKALYVEAIQTGLIEGDKTARRNASKSGKRSNSKGNAMGKEGSSLEADVPDNIINGAAADMV